jgi:hypothetical protein
MHREIWIRVAHVFLIGLAEAFIIGLGVSEIFGETAISGMSDSFKDVGGEYSIIAVTGWVGYIFPKVILLYAPLALFLGILLQLFWEEKTVAEPL